MITTVNALEVSGKASIHLLNEHVFAMYEDYLGGTPKKVIRSSRGIRVYEIDEMPSEVKAEASMPVALMSREHAIALISTKEMPSGLPKETQEAVLPVLKFI